MTKLSVNNSAYGKAAILTAAVAGFTGKDYTLVQGQILSLEHPGLPLVNQPNNVLRTLARIKNIPTLTGTSADDISHIEQWLSLTRTQLSSTIPSTLLQTLNQQLLLHTFLVGHRVTIADIVVYTHLATTVARLSAAQRAEYSNLMRWFDHIQYIPAIRAAKQVDLVEIAQTPSAIYSIDLHVETRPKAAPVVTEKVHKVDKTLVSKPAATASAPATAAPNGDNKKADKKADAKVAAPSKADGKKDTKKDTKGDKKETKEEDEAGSTNQIYRADIRVGKILSVKLHPKKEGCLIEEIDVGESTPRTVVSGLAQYYKPEQLQGQLVVLMVNVKPGDIEGVESNGRVLVATSTDGKTKEVAQPPTGAKIGERITFKNTPTDKIDGFVAPKNLHKIMKDLHTNDKKVVQYQSLDFTASTGVVTVPTVVNGTVA